MQPQISVDQNCVVVDVSNGISVFSLFCSSFHLSPALSPCSLSLSPSLRQLGSELERVQPRHLVKGSGLF